jgi:hypothetical protein
MPSLSNCRPTRPAESTVLRRSNKAAYIHYGDSYYVARMSELASARRVESTFRTQGGQPKIPFSRVLLSYEDSTREDKGRGALERSEGKDWEVPYHMQVSVQDTPHCRIQITGRRRSAFANHHTSVGFCLFAPTLPASYEGERAAGQQISRHHRLQF